MDSDKNVCIWLNKHGHIVEVQKDGRAIQPVKLSKNGELKVGDKGVLQDCQEILKVLILQLIVCSYPGKGSDPCWVVDPATGEGFWVC